MTRQTMGNQAEETGDIIEEIEVTEELTGEDEGLEIDQEPEETEEDEIIIAGEEQPTSKPVPKGFIKRISKLNGKVEKAEEHATEAERRLAMVEEENKLLRLKAQQQKPQGRPKAEEFDTDAEYDAALDSWDNERIEAIADRKAQERFEQTQQQTTQATIDASLEKNLSAHYERAEALKVSDYEVTEDKAIDTLGNDIVKQIMANTDKSHLIMYHLGKNPAKAERLANLIRTNPMKGVLEIGRLEASIQLKSKSKNVVDPETRIEGGDGASTVRSASGATFS